MAKFLQNGIDTEELLVSVSKLSHKLSHKLYYLSTTTLPHDSTGMENTRIIKFKTYS